MTFFRLTTYLTKSVSRFDWVACNEFKFLSLSGTPVVEVTTVPGTAKVQG